MTGLLRLAAWIALAGTAMAFLGFYHSWKAPPFTLLWTWELSRWGTPYGSYINKNHFAGLMEIGLAAALALMLHGARTLLEGTEDLGIWARLSRLLGRGAARVVLPFLAFCTMLVGLVASESRGGWGAMILSLLALLAWAALAKRSRAAWKLGALVVVVAVGAVMVVGPRELENRMTVQHRAVNRLHIWEDSVRMWTEFPVTGAGAGTFLYSFQPYHRIPDKRTATHAESDVLQTLTGVGLIGVLLLGWAGVRFVRAVRPGLEGELNPDRAFLAGTLVGVLSLSLHGLLDVNLQIPANGMFFALLVGISLATARHLEGRGILHWIDGSAARAQEEGDVT
jgi:O-antigen ligase